MTAPKLNTVNTYSFKIHALLSRHPKVCSSICVSDYSLFLKYSYVTVRGCALVRWPLVQLYQPRVEDECEAFGEGETANYHFLHHKMHRIWASKV